MSESKLLKVVSIIMIIGGALIALMGILGLVGGTFLAASSEAAGGLVMLSSIVMIVAAALELIAGILGVKNWNNPAKANTCFTMGIVLVVLSLANNIFSIVLSGFSASNLYSLVLGLVLPVLYVIGANQLKGAK